MRKVEDSRCVLFREFPARRLLLKFPRIAMVIKPVDVVILPNDWDRGTGDPLEPYQEFGAKAKTSSNDWSCYIRAKAGEVSVIYDLSHLRT